MLKKNLAKNVTIILLVVMFVVGAAGSFVATFEMDGYVKLLNAYAPLYISLIASIGANSAVKKVKEAKDV